MQYANFTISGGLSSGTIHVWRTKPSSTNPADWMVKRADIHPVGGKFSFGLLPGYSTRSRRSPGRGKGSATPPAQGTLGSYTDNPTANPLDATPVYLAPMDGAFEYTPCATDRTQTCTQQMAPQPPVYWFGRNGFPFAVIGDPSWQDYTVSTDVLFTQPDPRPVSSTASATKTAPSATSAATSSTSPTTAPGSCSRTARVHRREHPRLGQSWPPRPGVGQWHNLSLTISGATLTASIDGQQVATVTNNDPNYTTGIAGIEAGAVDEQRRLDRHLLAGRPIPATSPSPDTAATRGPPGEGDPAAGPAGCLYFTQPCLIGDGPAGPAVRPNDIVGLASGNGRGGVRTCDLSRVKRGRADLQGI